MNDRQQPIEAFKCGNFDFAMWNNQGEDLRPFQSVSIKRSYKDGNGNWQEGGEIRLLPQQLNDLALGANEMFRFWRLGAKQRKPQQQAVSESQASSPDSEPAAEQPAAEKQGSCEAPEQREPTGVESASESGFVEKVTQQRGGRKSR